MHVPAHRRHIYVHVFVAAVIVVLTVLNICRMVWVPMTHDEAITVVHFLSRSYSDIVNCHPPSPSNHILNTVFTKFFSQLFHSKSLFVLRLGNLLAQLLFMLSSYGLMLQIFKKPLWVAGCFIVVNLNPFMFEFWGLTRGYGLALAFMMCSIYFFIRYLLTEKYVLLWVGFLFGISSVFSNFSLLNFYIAYNIVIIANAVLRPTHNNMRRFFIRELPALITAGVVLYVMIDIPMHVLRSKNELNYGGSNGIIQDTVRSLVMQSLFINDRTNIVVVTIAYVIVVSIIIIGIYWARKYVRQQIDDELIIGMLLWLLLVVPILFRLIQHFSSNTKYQLDRTALFLIPLYMMHPIYWHYYRNRNNTTISPFLLLISCFITVNFCRHINFHTTRLWPYDQYAQTASRHIATETRSTDKVSICMSRKLMPAISYYMLCSYNRDNVLIDSLGQKDIADTAFNYYYTFKRDISFIPSSYYRDTMFTYSDDSLVLYRRIH